MVITPLIKPYLLGGSFVGGTLGSHDISLDKNVDQDQDDLPIEKKSRSSVRITISQPTGRAAPSGCRAEPTFFVFLPETNEKN